MALTNFFTQNEIKNGFSSPDRVEDLINVMRFENDKEVMNVEEISREWSTVAKTIACTGRKECLECFVQLGGLCFVNTWLNNILRNASDIPDAVMEELLLTLLLALEKLPVDDEKLTSTGVGVTLKSLIVYNSNVIKERVQTLLDSWKLHTNTSEVEVDVKEDMAANGCTEVKSSSTETSYLNANTEVKSTGTCPNAGTPDFLSAEEVKDEPNEECSSSTEVGTADSLEHEAVKDGKSDPQSTDLCTVKENISITGLMSADVSTGTTITKNESYSNSKSEAYGINR